METVIPRMSDALEALEEAISDELIADLTRAAQNEMAKRSRTAGISRSSSSGGKSAEDFVTEAVERVLDDSGAYNWDPSRNPDIGAYLKVVIRGVVTTHYRLKATRQEDSLPEEADGEYEGTPAELQDLENPRETLAAKRDAQRDEEIKDRVLELVEDDEQLTGLVLAILEGHSKPREIAGALGITTDEVQLAKRKLKRLLGKENVFPVDGGDRKREE